MTDIMKLADDYARWSATSFSSDAVSETRSALQSAIGALQATQASQSMQLAHDAVTIECLNDKVLAMQGEVERLENERDSANNQVFLIEHNYYALKSKLDELQRQEPVAWTLTEELTKRETTTRAHLWFTDPVNCMWSPLYAAPKALEPLTVEEIERIYQRYGGDMVNCTRAIERHHGITKGTP